VIALCCTQKVRRRLALSPVLSVPPEPTTRLGNWYVNLVHYGRQQVILATSERSLLTVVLPARHLRETLEGALRTSVEQLAHLNDQALPARDTWVRDELANAPTWLLAAGIAEAHAAVGIG
jgi:hypothetical protein